MSKNPFRLPTWVPQDDSEDDTDEREEPSTYEEFDAFISLRVPPEQRERLLAGLVALQIIEARIAEDNPDA